MCNQLSRFCWTKLTVSKYFYLFWLNESHNDDDMVGCTEKYIPRGIVEEDSGQLHINFGSSYKTSYFIVDSLIEWWNKITP